MNLLSINVSHLVYNPILGGIISSACFAVASSLYFLCLRRMSHVSLKSLIPNSNSNVAVVCPGESEQMAAGKVLMTQEEAMALAEVLQCVGILNMKPIIYSCTETMRQSGVISLGGIQNNTFTKTLLAEFCPGLKIGTSTPEGSESQILYGSDSVRPTWRNSVAFIIYLSDRTTKCENPSLLVFGEYGIDTVAAARYVRTCAKQLHRNFHGRDFAVLLVTHPALGYAGFPRRHRDISAEVFAA